MNLPAFQFDPESARFGASRSQKRVEDARLVTGRGLFSDDRALPGEVWLVVVRSPHAHARIDSIDASAAKAAPGVVAVWSNADLKADGVGAIPHPPLFKRADGSPMAIAPRYPLADDAARYVGQPVVAVVAATRRQAQDAAELVEVRYGTLPCVTDARRGRARRTAGLARRAGNVARVASAIGSGRRRARKCAHVVKSRSTTSGSPPSARAAPRSRRTPTAARRCTRRRSNRPARAICSVRPSAPSRMPSGS
jgi:CO/xanthine dehydrogenase Mo-binding subunit